MDQCIRIIVPGVPDRSDIVHVLEQSIGDAFAQEGLGHLTDEVQGIIEEKMAVYDMYLKDGGCGTRFLAATHREQVIGVISFGPRGPAIRECAGAALADIGELGTLYVLPDYQNQGVGSALIRALLEQLAAEGVEQFCLDSGFARAQQRWRRKFGAPYVTVPNYWGPGSANMVWLCNVRDHV